MRRWATTPTPIRRNGPAPGGPARPTIEQVAARAGVSVATVSRALRGLPNVAPATRERVAGAARELGYRADPIATRLATGRTRTIGVIVPAINSWYFANVVAGVESVCAAEGYDVLMLCLPRREARQDVLSAARALGRRVDGIVFVEVPLRTEDVASLQAARLDVVTIGQRVSPFPSVMVDNEEIGRAAADHLLDLGHVHLGVIGGEPDLPAYSEVPGCRIAGVRAALAGRGLELPVGAVQITEFTVEGGAAAAERLLTRPRPPTAIVALSDEMAFGAMSVARALGRAVPDELSIIGVDDHEVSAAVGLTTIRQAVPDHGALAARALLRALAGDVDDPPDRLTAGHELVVRTSTAPPTAP